MPILYVEKLGGQANFGGAKARLRSVGQLDTSELSVKELRSVNSLFKRAKPVETRPDAFRFLIMRNTVAGQETIEASESCIPLALASCVKDEFL
jgi:hypothetical protein